MDSEGEDYCQDTASDWPEEEAGDWMEEGGDDDDKPQNSAATDRRKSYKILSEEDIERLQENDISTVSGVLSVPRGVAVALLCRNNWSLTSVYDHWFTAAADDGGERSPPPMERESIKRLIMCNVCYEITDLKEAASAACGHPFCKNCFNLYIAAAVRAGASCLTLNCPAPGCGAAVTSDTVEKLASKADFSRYNQYLLRSYIELSRNRKWCPYPGCDRAIELDDVGVESYDVVCDCLCAFCWGCTGERHSPLSCTAAKEWSESATWIIANTKPCPKCRRPIEKAEDGCNHMICLSPCRFQFCWACLEPWKGEPCPHCAAAREEMERRLKEMSQRSRWGPPGEEIERRLYLDSNAVTAKLVKKFTGGNCYERWDFNEKSRKFAMDELGKARRKYAGDGKGGLQFMVEAWEKIVECWHVLNWSYVYLYSLPEVAGKRAVLEHFQSEAEGALERLQCRLEEQTGEGVDHVDTDPDFWKFRSGLAKLSDVATNYFEGLVMAMKDEVESYAVYWEKEALELKNDIAITQSYAVDLEMEDLEAKNDIAVVESYALDLEALEECLDSENDVVEDKETVYSKNGAVHDEAALASKNDVVEVSSVMKETIALKNEVVEVGTDALHVAALMSKIKTLALKNDEVEPSEMKETLDLKNDVAALVSKMKETIAMKSAADALDLALEMMKETLVLNKDLAEVWSSALDHARNDLARSAGDLDSEKESDDLMNESPGVESYALDSKKDALDVKNDLADAESFVLVSDSDKEADFDDSFVLV